MGRVGSRVMGRYHRCFREISSDPRPVKVSETRYPSSNKRRLGLDPPDVFVYVFLPPLLLDSEYFRY